MAAPAWAWAAVKLKLAGVRYPGSGTRDPGSDHPAPRFWIDRITDPGKRIPTSRV